MECWWAWKRECAVDGVHFNEVREGLGNVHSSNTCTGLPLVCQWAISITELEVRKRTVKQRVGRSYMAYW